MGHADISYCGRALLAMIRHNIVGSYAVKLNPIDLRGRYQANCELPTILGLGAKH